MSLTHRQQTILYLMREYGIGNFRSGSRWWAYTVMGKGNETEVCMWGFQSPEWHLEARGLIERADANDTDPGVYSRTGRFVLTLAGRKAAERLTEDCLTEPSRYSRMSRRARR